MRICTVLAAMALLMAGAREASAQMFNFDKDPVDQPPHGFSCGLTGGGRPGVWVVKADNGQRNYDLEDAASRVPANSGSGPRPIR